MRKKPTQSTINRLVSLSGNQCAFPGCEETLVNQDGNLIGEVCHIEAAEPGGERYNAEQTDEDRRSLANLILLCANHHKVTNDTKKYDVTALVSMKSEHEKKYLRSPYSASNKVKEQLDRILEIAENPTPTKSHDVEIISDAQHEQVMGEIQEKFENQVRGARIRFGDSSAVQGAGMAYQKIASKKRAEQMRKKTASDEMYKLESQDIRDHFAELIQAKREELNQRGLIYSGIGNQEIEKIERKKNRELKKLSIKYGKLVE